MRVETRLSGWLGLALSVVFVLIAAAAAILGFVIHGQKPENVAAEFAAWLFAMLFAVMGLLWFLPASIGTLKDADPN